MRLDKNEVQVLKTKIQSLSSDAQLYLFGSRIDDTKNCS